jgi:hypothetical protein
MHTCMYLGQAEGNAIKRALQYVIKKEGLATRSAPCRTLTWQAFLPAGSAHPRS